MTRKKEIKKISVYPCFPTYQDGSAVFVVFASTDYCRLITDYFKKNCRVGWLDPRKDYYVDTY